MRLPLARHRGFSRLRSPSPQAVLAEGDDSHGASEIAARISRAICRRAALPIEDHGQMQHGPLDDDSENEGGDDG